MAISWLKMFNTFASVIVAGLAGEGMTESLAKFNFNNYEYAHYASYFIAILIFILLNIGRMDFTKSKK